MPEPELTPDDHAVHWLTTLRGDPSTANRDAFEDWYARDPGNADAYDRVLASWEKLGMATGTAPASSVPGIGSRPTGRRVRRLLAGSAAVAAAVTLVIVTGRDAGPGGPLFAAAYASARGQIRTIGLPDGTQVVLDTGSAMEAAYTRRERHIALVRGRARFTVVQEPRPFIVSAGKRVIATAATVFDVDLTSGKVSVSTLEGRVSVGEPSADPPQMLSAGQRLTYRDGAPTGVFGTVDSSEAKWPNGMLSFENTSVSDVVEQANRYAKTKIVLDDPTIGRLRFTGTVRDGANDELAEMLAVIFHLDRAKDASQNIVLRKSSSALK